MVSVNDYFLMFLILEIQSISLYVLVALKNSNLSKEAALKYFFYGSFASGILVIGVSLIYGAMGTTNLTDINLLLGAAYNSIPLMFFLGVIFVLVGLFFKLGIAPFHS